MSDEPLLVGTVLRARSGFYTVKTPGGVFESRLRGLLKKERRTSDIAVIGDSVSVEPLPDGTGAIAAVHERRTRFSRRQPGPRGSWREDVLVANLDQVAIVFACADPPPSLRLLDRFLVVAEDNEIEALIVANKVDLVGTDAARAVFDAYAALGYGVIYTSARTGLGVEELRTSLAGRISVIAGPSGAGKSTLLNSLQPGLRLLTGEVSESLHKGRHTTTMAELIPLDGPMGGHVADTPGLRELSLWQIPPDDLAWAFREFRPSIGGCAFNDCTHLHEPRCAVLAAVAAGEISEARYDSYRRMLIGE